MKFFIHRPNCKYIMEEFYCDTWSLVEVFCQNCACRNDRYCKSTEKQIYKDAYIMRFYGR